jgi:hypothetical protein
VILQDIGSEMFDHFIYCVSLFVYRGVVQFSSLEVSAHKGYRCFIVFIILLGKYRNQGLVRSKGIKEKILAEIRAL